MDLENNGEMVLLEKLANQIKGHGNWFGYGDFWRFLEIFGAVVYPKKRQGRKTPTYHDI
jgi:hypothetical protein